MPASPLSFRTISLSVPGSSRSSAPGRPAVCQPGRAPVRLPVNPTPASRPAPRPGARPGKRTGKLPIFTIPGTTFHHIVTIDKQRFVNLCPVGGAAAFKNQRAASSAIASRPRTKSVRSTAPLRAGALRGLRLDAAPCGAGARIWSALALRFTRTAKNNDFYLLTCNPNLLNTSWRGRCRALGIFPIDTAKIRRCTRRIYAHAAD